MLGDSATVCEQRVALGRFSDPWTGRGESNKTHSNVRMSARPPVLSVCAFSCMQARSQRRSCEQKHNLREPLKHGMTTPRKCGRRRRSERKGGGGERKSKRKWPVCQSELTRAHRRIKRKKSKGRERGRKEERGLKRRGILV